MSCQAATGAPSTASTSSPGASPAAAAGVSGATSPTSGRRPVSPSMNTSAYSTAASSRLIAGPAATIAARWASGRCVNS